MISIYYTLSTLITLIGRVSLGVKSTLSLKYTTFPIYSLPKPSYKSLRFCLEIVC